MRSIATARRPAQNLRHAIPSRTALALLAVLVGASALAAPRGAEAASGGNLSSRLATSEVPVLVEFWAPWCAPCRRLEKPLADLAREMDGQVRVMRVNIDSNPSAAQRYGVELLPTMVFFDRGEEVDRLTGVPPTSELRDRLSTILRASNDANTIAPATLAVASR